jgi:REP element-mobilizing transposase RayT
MSENKKTYPEGLYFITLTIVGWINLLDRDCYKQILVENLQYCQKKEGLEIFAYVIMSNHIHMIASRNSEDDLTELLGRFKSVTSKKFIKEINNNAQESRRDWLLYQFNYFANKNSQYDEFHIWQYTNHPTVLFSNNVIQQKVNYIHENPLRAGIVNDITAYIYSSACADSPLKVSEL